MYVCMYNVRTKGRMSQSLGFTVRYVWSHIDLTNQYMYVLYGHEVRHARMNVCM